MGSDNRFCIASERKCLKRFGLCFFLNSPKYWKTSGPLWGFFNPLPSDWLGVRDQHSREDIGRYHGLRQLLCWLSSHFLASGKDSNWESLPPGQVSEEKHYTLFMLDYLILELERCFFFRHLTPSRSEGQLMDLKLEQLILVRVSLGYPCTHVEQLEID